MDVPVKHLRVLQERKMRPVGGRREESFDVRVVATTLCNLDVELAAGRFREDLLYRLAAFEVTLPPLREPGDDIVLLAQAFVAAYSGMVGVRDRRLGRTVGAALRKHAWPGNVRELQCVLLRAATLGDGRTIAGADIQKVVGAGGCGSTLSERLRDMLASRDGMSMAQITAALRVPRTSAWRALATLVKEGTVEFSGVGKARRYSLLNRAAANARVPADEASRAVLEMACPWTHAGSLGRGRFAHC